MEPNSKTIDAWFSMIREGQLTLPRFQRGEVWNATQVKAILENVVRKPSLPIGALLTLDVVTKELFVSKTISNTPKSKGRVILNLLDGQQRLTALWRALNDDYDNYTLCISLKDSNCPDVEIVKYRKDGKEYKPPAWVNDPVKCLERELFPAKLLLPGINEPHLIKDWGSTATQQDDKLALDLIRHIDEICHRVIGYRIPFLSLPESTDRITALRVYINMNRSSSPLKDFDIVVAQVEEKLENSLNDMITNLKEEVPIAKDYGRIEDIALAVGALLNSKTPGKETYLHKNFARELDAVWDNVVSGISRGTKFLRNEMILNKDLLPTDVIVYLTSALWVCVPADDVDQEGHIRNIIRKTIWRASCTERYSKAANTGAAADYKAIRNQIMNPNATKKPELFDDKKNPLPRLDDLIRSTWPSRKDRLTRAIMAASLYYGGHDFASDEPASTDNIKSREYHHIFPKALIQGKFPSEEVNSALNCAFISWKTNRKISAKSPKEYLKDRTKHFNISDYIVRARLKSHMIPYDLLIKNDFRAFLDGRAKLVLDAITELCNGHDIRRL